MLRSCCRAGCLRTPEHGASPALWIHLPSWLGSHARAWSQPGFWILVCLFWCCWLNGPFFLKTIAGLAAFARRSVEPARHLGTCRLSTLPAPCCVEKLLPRWLSSHAGAWSHGFDSNSVEECLVGTLGLGASLTLQVFLLSLSTFLNPASTPERGASPAFWIHLPSWLGSRAGAWSQPGFWILVCLFWCCWLNGPFFLKTILPGWLCSHAGAWSQPGFQGFVRRLSSHAGAWS